MNKELSDEVDVKETQPKLDYIGRVPSAPMGKTLI